VTRVSLLCGMAQPPRSLGNIAAGAAGSVCGVPILSLYLAKLEAEKRHVEEVAGLHMRTIEALALAIEAKDQNTHAHLQRVRIYAVELARKLRLPQEEIEAIQAAALLHDIGKLAVPEHIISKPGS